MWSHCIGLVIALTTGCYNRGGTGDLYGKDFPANAFKTAATVVIVRRTVRLAECASRRNERAGGADRPSKREIHE